MQAADIVRIMGIGRNEYIATMVQVGGCEVLWFEQLPKPWVAFVC